MFRGILLISAALFFTGCAGIQTRDSANRGLFQRRGGEEKMTAPMYSQGAPVASMEGFIWPIKATAAISSHFGKRRRDFHEGIDIQCPKGTPVYAAKDGLVIYSSRRIRGYGNMVVLKHSDGSATVYAHNTKNLVNKGTRVKQGENIAKVGATGKATGPHLHFEIRKGQLPVDPMSFLPPFRYPAQARAE